MEKPVVQYPSSYGHSQMDKISTKEISLLMCIFDFLHPIHKIVLKILLMNWSGSSNKHLLILSDPAGRVGMFVFLKSMKAENIPPSVWQSAFDTMGVCLISFPGAKH